MRAERLRRLLVLQQRAVNALAADEAVTASYGLVAAAVADAGRTTRARSMELLIAATAHAHSARLYPRNVKEFDGLGDLIDIVAA